MNRDKRTARFIQLLAIIVCLGMTGFVVQNTGLISKIGTEDIYWERARFLLGQKGATLYNGSSICSLGYSLLLVPICIVIKSSYAAYKVAILLNGIFLCGSYVMAVLTAKKLFSKEKESFLSVACFFAVFIPAISISMFYTGPEFLVLLLFWCSVYLLCQIWSCGTVKNLVLFIMCLFSMTFLQIELLGVVLAYVALLGLFVRKKKINELTFLKCILAILIGIIAEDIVEKIVLYRFASDMDLIIRSSLEILFDNIKSSTKNGNLTGTLFGKIYILSLTGGFLIYPAFWGYLRDLSEAVKQKKNTEHFLVNEIITIFLIQTVFIIIFDSARYIASGYLSVNGLLTVASPILLIGILYFKYQKNWTSIILGEFLITGLCAYKIAGIFEKNNISSASGMTCGIFKLFQDGTSNVSAAIYMSVCIAFLIVIVGIFFFKWKSEKVLKTKWLRIIGVSVTSGIIVILGIQMLQHTAGRAYESEMQEFVPVASLSNSVTEEAEYYYVVGSGNDAGIAVIQSLMPDKAITQIKNDAAEQEKIFRTKIQKDENPVVITGADENQLNQTVESWMRDFDMLYMTPVYAVWVRKESKIASEIETIIETRAEEMTLQSSEELDEEELTEAESQNNTETVTETESDTEAVTDTESLTETDSSVEIEKKNYKKEVYKNNTNLAHGTYRVEIYFKGEDLQVDQTGQIRVRSKEGSICAKKFDKDTILQDSNRAVVVEISSRYTMHDVEIQIEGNILASVSVEHIYYRKISDSYRIGYASEKQVNAACDTIKKMDENCKQKGDIAFVDAIASKADEISVECFQRNLEGYQVKSIVKAEAAEVDTVYLIATTSLHSYYEAMENYSIISRSKNYTILVKNESEQYQECQKQGRILSDGNKISMTAFVSKKNVEKPISLEMGSYEYEVCVTGEENDSENAVSEIVGTVVIRNEEKIFAEREITKEEAGEEHIVDIPLHLYERTEGIYCEITNTKENEVSVTPVAISLTNEKYQYGQEEKEFSKLLSSINVILSDNQRIGKTKVAIVQSTKAIKAQQTGYEAIEEALSKCQIEEMDFSSAKQLTEDAILLTYGISKQHFQLLDKYSIIGQAGQYTLWVRNNGELLQKAIQNGFPAVNSGKKISIECIRKMSGQGDNDIVNLPKAEYNVVVELEASELEADDTVEVNLFRDKSEKEILSEIKMLMDAGCTRKEAKKRVDLQTSCGSGTFEAYAFNGAKTKLVNIKIIASVNIENLIANVFSWKGCKVESRILWIALNEQ